MAPHELSIHVYPTDCDMLGHVNHATMITFLEHARWAFVEAREREVARIEPHFAPGNYLRGGVTSVVRHVDIGYSAQALPGDDLVVRSGLLSVGNSSFVVRQQVLKQPAGPIVADARITLVCVGAEGRPVPVPDEWRHIFPEWPADGAG